MSDSGTPVKVPIQTTVSNNGLTIYNNQNCTNYQVQISSSNGNAQTVNLSVPSGVYVSSPSVSVPSSGSVNAYVYVPTTNNGTVNLTASEAGFDNRAVSIQP